MRSSSSILARVPFATRAAASSIALVPEVGTFWGTSKAINEVMYPGTNVYDLKTNVREILGLGMTLGFLKSLGFAFGRVGATAKQRQWSYLPQHPMFWQQSGMLAGISAGHGTEILLGWRAPTDVTTFLTESLITLGHFNMGGALSHQMFPGIYRVNARIQQKMAGQERAQWEKLQGVPGTFGAEAIPAAGPPVSGERAGLPHILKMVSKDGPEGPVPSIGPKGEMIATVSSIERGLRLPKPSNTHSFIQLAEFLIERYPEDLGHIKVPGPKQMIKQYPRVLAEIELARVNSENRLEIAQTARDWVLNNFKFIHPNGAEGSLKGVMDPYAQAKETLWGEARGINPVHDPTKPMGPGHRATLRHEGTVFDTLEKITAWTGEQLSKGNISPSMAAKIEWSAREAYSETARAEGRYGHFRFHNPGETPRKVWPEFVVLRVF